MANKVSGINVQPIKQELLDILACPACETRPAVILTPDKQFLKCTECGRRYPINKGIPVMLVDEAVVDSGG